MDRESTCDRDPLALSTAQLVRSMLGVFVDADDVQIMRDALRTFGLRQLLDLQQGILDVLGCGEDRQEIERLEDEADGATAQIGEFVGRLAADVDAVDVDTPRCRGVDTADEIEQRRLATTGRARDRQEDTRLDAERHFLQRVHLLPT